MLRSARLTPPGPTLSPIGWTTPYRSGISRSWRMLSKPPTENADTTKSASASALRRSGSARTVIAMSRRRAISVPSSAIVVARS